MPPTYDQCPHTTFLIAPGVVAEAIRCQDCGRSSTDAVADLAWRLADLTRALGIAVSDVSAMASELERPAFTPLDAIDDYCAMLAGRLRSIAAALDAANPKLSAAG